jgi:hypothetical protein
MGTSFLQATIGPKDADGNANRVAAGIVDDPGVALSNTDFALALSTATTGYVALMGGTVSYNTSTGAVTGTVGVSGGSVTLTQSHGNSLSALLSTAGVALIAAQSVVTQSGSVLMAYDNTLTVSQLKGCLRGMLQTLGN